MSSFLSENFLKIVSLVLTIIAMLGSIVQFQTFSLEVHGKQVDRLNLMFGQYLAGAQFITDNPLEYKKGTLSAEKLTGLDGGLFDTKFNFQIKKYYMQVNLTDGSKIWSFGDVSILKENYKIWEHPIAVNMSDTILPAKMTVYVPKVG